MCGLVRQQRSQLGGGKGRDTQQLQDTRYRSVEAAATRAEGRGSRHDPDTARGESVVPCLSSSPLTRPHASMRPLPNEPQQLLNRRLDLCQSQHALQVL